jgi:muconate cycloisomerase
LTPNTRLRTIPPTAQERADLATVTPRQLDVYRTALPMRSFEHAAASRSVAEAVVVRVTFADNSQGWGETLPREYVTGETLGTVPADLEETLWPAMVGRALDEAALLDLPTSSPDGHCINAALCAVELACRDALMRKDTSSQSLPIRQRVSAVLGSRDPKKTAKRLCLFRLAGLRDVKLKLGLGEAVDRANLGVVHKRLGRHLRSGRCTLRVDVNGGWSADETPERIEELRRYGVSAVEQPVYCSAGELAELSERCSVPLIADESLLADADARELMPVGRKVWWNLRLSKNGGLSRTCRLAKHAAEHCIPAIAGCMVGESGILSAAQRRLLQRSPDVRHVEGNYGRFLLGDDVARPSPRFGWRGKLKPLRRGGLGVEVDIATLREYGELVASHT